MSSRSTDRRTRRAQPCGEALETRNLLTGGAGNTFALVPGTIADVNGTKQVPFTIDPARFTLPKRKMTLGIDVAAPTGSTLNPLISKVIDAHGSGIPQAFHSIYNPHLGQGAIAAGKAGTGAVLTPITLYPRNNNPITYQATVSAMNKTSGDFLLGFYLPGDADGNGTVDQSDINAIKKAFGSVAGDADYNFDADANRDGRIGFIDLTYARQNLGVSTTISPVISANIDTASATNRSTTNSSVHFTGAATPGATITYADVSKALPNVSTTADATGNYSVTVPLSLGQNTFQVTSIDSFGQTISGKISPVTRGPAGAMATVNGGTTTTTSGQPNGQG